MNDLNTLLNIILICAILYVAYRFALKIVATYLRVKVKRSLLKMYPLIPFFKQDELDQLKEILNKLDAETGIDKKFIYNIKLLIEIREKMLNE